MGFYPSLPLNNPTHTRLSHTHAPLEGSAPSDCRQGATRMAEEASTLAQETLRLALWLIR